MKNKRVSKMGQKLLTLALAVALVLSLVPLLLVSIQPTVSAAEENTPTSWGLGAVNSFEWSFTDTIQRKSSPENYIETGSILIG